MKLKLDLHVHSEASVDGRMPIAQIIKLAKARGLDGVAVCDHDRVMAGIFESPDFILIPGTEISTDHGHLLGLFVTERIDTRDIREAVERIHAQGGIAVLAHPFEHSGDPERIETITSILDGAEAWNSRANRKNRRANAMAAQFISSHGLTAFGGSDAHVPQELGNAYTQVEAGGRSPEAVKAALLAGDTRAYGCESPTRYVAASQFTRRRKSGAAVRSYIRWAAFAAKCLVQDITRRRESNVADS